MQCAIGEVLAVNDRRRIAHEAPVSGDPRALSESLFGSAHRLRNANDKSAGDHAREINP